MPKNRHGKPFLISHIARVTGLNKSIIAEVLNELPAAIMKAVHDETYAGLRIPDLGIFALAFRRARIGRNPSTGEALSIPASIYLKFKQASTVKANLNEED